MWATTLGLVLLISPAIGRDDAGMLVVGAAFLAMQIVLFLGNKVSYVDKADQSKHCAE
jgi:hypothetical protein